MMHVAVLLILSSSSTLSPLLVLFKPGQPSTGGFPFVMLVLLMILFKREFLLPPLCGSGFGCADNIDCRIKLLQLNFFKCIL